MELPMMITQCNECDRLSVIGALSSRCSCGTPAWNRTVVDLEELEASKMRHPAGWLTS